MLMLGDSTGSSDPQHSQEARRKTKKNVFLPFVSSPAFCTPKSLLCPELAPRHHPAKKQSAPITSGLSSSLFACRLYRKAEGRCLKVPQLPICPFPAGKPRCLGKISPPGCTFRFCFEFELPDKQHAGSHPHLPSKIPAVAAKPR